MTLAGQKRKRDVLSAEPEERRDGPSHISPFASLFAQATTAPAVPAVPVVPTVPEKKKQKKSTKKAKSDESLGGHPAAIFKTPTNLQATLEGLPAELRLQIYDQLCDSTLIHVHRHIEGDEYQFTWTPCRSPNPASPLLCANPKWSGMCDEEDRCTYKLYAPPEPIGFWGLASTSKLIRNEAQEFFLRRTVVSIHPQHLDTWLSHLERRNPGQINHIRRITLAGPNTYPAMSSVVLQTLQNRLPNIEGVGFQCQDSLWRWVRSYANNDIQVDATAWKRWRALELLLTLDSSITVAAEAMMWRKTHWRWRPNEVEQQVAVRVLRKGKPEEGGVKKQGKGWTEEDVEVEIDKPGKVVAYKRTAKWRQWWRTKETKGMAS